MSLKIISTGRAIPRRTITNDFLSSFVDTDDEWIVSRTGIRSRYVCEEETLTGLCEAAANQALEGSGLSVREIDMIICSTLGGEYVLPSLACAVSERLGAVCPAFDLNAACTGFIYALDIASAYISCGRANNILILCAEMMSKHVDWSDRSTCVLFGDGAGACIVSDGNALRYTKIATKGDTKILFREDGNGNTPFSARRENGFIKMQGQEVFKFAVNMIESQTNAALDALSLNAEDIDLFLLHQANKRIVDFARAKLRQPEEKFPTNIEKYGNISSASIPILLDELLENGKIKKGDKLLLSAFGAGLCAGTCILIWE